MSASTTATPVPASTVAALAAWHALVRSGGADGLDALLADDASFHSPVVHTPQRGRALVRAYLAAAATVFFGAEFRYVREIVGPYDAVLEFVATIDGVEVNGVDLIRWDTTGRIVDFKVMVRPLKAIEAVRARMVAALQRTGPS